MSRGDAFVMVHAYKTGISEGVFTDHSMLNSEIGMCFTGKQSCYSLVKNTHIFINVSLVPTYALVLSYTKIT